jgi:Kef-type K+ transport system membrane component KefB
LEGTGLKAAVIYTLLLLAAIAGFFFIKSHGEDLVAPQPLQIDSKDRPSAPAPEVLPHLMLALAAVIATGRVLGRIFKRIGQPPVIGEVIGGILLGPSFLGLISREAYLFVLPPEAAPYLGVVAQLGVVIYMFLVGLELNPEVLRQRIHTTIAISHASIVVPFVLGAAAALYLYPRLSTSDVPFTSFALFMGLSMSITAFPVLARILSDCRIIHTELGIIALTCAAVDDVTAWCLLAFVVGVAQAATGGALIVALLTMGFIGLMFFGVRPIMSRMAARLEKQPPGQGTVALMLVGLLLSALSTEAIGIHAIFGAFLFGAVIPHDSRLARTLDDGLRSVATILLLPAFFAFTGMRTEIGLLSSAGDWLFCGLIILVATAGKFGGTFLAARATGLNWRYASGLGVLMNTRGLMELIVLNVGLDLGVISPTLFTMMVMMALVTTIATTPILRKLVPEAQKAFASGSVVPAIPR